ncbi:SLC13 family permease [Sandaracinobacter sp. RS1-74]|uniref:SLC13 family permease n=1 Tax=Sandaracinobacteroides sayramensis TaxID=2913411 RepID=UPI001EDC7587|nr:SLC13 family permease [Sandaracinobacteroides sayramensis]MCG2839642.1 SLC13 family permease [Sandaracinobacteroides sayramensis]
MSDITIVFLIIIGAVILFIQNKLPVVIVALAVPFALYMTGVLSLQEVFSGFGDPTIIFIATLFVVSAGLEAAGVTAWVGQKLIKWAGTESRSRLLVFTILIVAVLTAMISVNGAVAALLPVVVVMAIRTGTKTSQLLMPLAFGAHCGSMLAMSGTPISVITNDALMDATGESFAFFEFAWVGIPLVIGGILIMLLFGKKLLPETQGPSLPADFSRHASTLSEQYRLEGQFFRLKLREESPLVGTAARNLDLAGFPGLKVVRLKDAEGAPMAAEAPLLPGQSIILSGPAETVAALAGAKGLAFIGAGASEDVEIDDKPGIEEAFFNRASGLAEVVVPPRSRLVGEMAFPGMTAGDGELVVLAIHRGGEALPPGAQKLAAGDTILVQGSWAALDRHLADPAVLVVDSPEVVRKQAVPFGLGAKAAIIILLAMVAMLAFDLVQPAIAGLIAATAVILTGLLKVEESYRAINWTTIILVGAMMPLSTAMFQTGAAQMLADNLVLVLGDAGPTALLAGLFLISAVLGQVISNTATALIVIPIAVLAARGLDVNVTPVLMSVNVACAAAFLTPIATPVNLMVMGPGGYKFTDYWKLGGLMMILFFLVSVFWVPVVWPF